MSIEKIIEYGMFVAISGYLTWQRLVTNKARKVQEAEEAAEAEKERLFGLKPNPTRCGEHTAAIHELSEAVADLRVDIERLRGDFKAHVASHK